MHARRFVLRRGPRAIERVAAGSAFFPDHRSVASSHTVIGIGRPRGAAPGCRVVRRTPADDTARGNQPRSKSSGREPAARGRQRDGHATPNAKPVPAARKKNRASADALLFRLIMSVGRQIATRSGMSSPRTTLHVASANRGTAAHELAEQARRQGTHLQAFPLRRARTIDADLDEPGVVQPVRRDHRDAQRVDLRCLRKNVLAPPLVVIADGQRQRNITAAP